MTNATPLKAMHTTGTDGSKLHRRGALDDSQLQVRRPASTFVEGAGGIDP